MAYRPSERFIVLNIIVGEMVRKPSSKPKRACILHIILCGVLAFEPKSWKNPFHMMDSFNVLIFIMSIVC